MATEDAQRKTEQELLAAAGEPPDTSTSGKAAPLYQMLGDDKIPVSRSTGMLWKHRRDIARKRMDDFLPAWEEALRYYEHDHSADSTQHTSKGTRRKGDETENIVFSNISTLMPILYSKNPTIEFTTERPDDDAANEFTTMIERVTNILIRRRHTMGINLKHHVRRMTLFSALCNISWIKIGWTLRDDSSDLVINQINKIAKQLAKSKSQQEIQKLEGQLMAMEERFNYLQPSGPTAKTCHPGNVYVDPECEDPHLTDCLWLIECDYLPTEMIRAVYLKPAGRDKGEDKLLYNPTHVLKNANQESEQNVLDSAFSEIQDNADWKKFGFGTEEEYRSAQYTKVWYVWDKVTRRVYLFHDGDWTWPLWVWEDPYNLTRFFPYFAMSFHESTRGFYAKGETTYYLDQQDAVNEINAQMAKTRRQLMSKVIYNRNRVGGKEIERFLSAEDESVLGLDLPEDMTINDVIMQVDPVEVKFGDVFDKRDKFAAADRIAGINEVLRGQQLRTNTTEEAVGLLNDATQIRIDEKTDKIEELIADVCWSLAEMAVQFMSQEQVTVLIGQRYGSQWKNMHPKDFSSDYTMTIVGGSTEKPTSKAKKQQALEIGQVLGQFVNASPAAVLVILKLFQRAFTDMTITDTDWDMITKTLEAQMQKGISTSTQPNGAAGPTTAGSDGLTSVSQPQAAALNGNGEQSGDVGQQIISMIMKVLPDEIKQQIAEAIQAGQSPMQLIVDTIQQLAQNQRAMQ